MREKRRHRQVSAGTGIDVRLFQFCIPGKNGGQNILQPTGFPHQCSQWSLLVRESARRQPDRACGRYGYPEMPRGSRDKSRVSPVADLPTLQAWRRAEARPAQKHPQSPSHTVGQRDRGPLPRPWPRAGLLWRAQTHHGGQSFPSRLATHAQWLERQASASSLSRLPSACASEYRRSHGLVSAAAARGAHSKIIPRFVLVSTAAAVASTAPRIRAPTLCPTGGERARSRCRAAFKILDGQSMAIGEHMDVAGLWRIEFVLGRHLRKLWRSGLATREPAQTLRWACVGKLATRSLASVAAMSIDVVRCNPDHAGMLFTSSTDRRPS